MELRQPFIEQGLPVRRVQSGETVEVAVDFGHDADLTAEVLDETVIVIAGGEQYEIGIDGSAEVFISNGVLTIEVER